MKKLNKTQEMAQWAKDNGYTHIATIVKQVFSTCYYNVNSVESVLRDGKIQGAPFSGHYNYRRGVIGTEIDWDTTISRVDAKARMPK